MLSARSERVGQHRAGTRSLCALPLGTSGRATFQQKPREVFGDGVGVELRAGRGKELRGAGQRWLWLQAPCLPTLNQPGRRPP